MQMETHMETEMGMEMGMGMTALSTLTMVTCKCPGEGGTPSHGGESAASQMETKTQWLPAVSSCRLKALR